MASSLADGKRGSSDDDLVITRAIFCASERDRRIDKPNTYLTFETEAEAITNAAMLVVLRTPYSRRYASTPNPAHRSPVLRTKIYLFLSTPQGCGKARITKRY